jgi:hypothetical protein
MRCKILITIDTEEDLWSKWDRRDNPVENINRIPVLQNIFDEFGAKPLYLINYPVATNNKALKILKKIYEEDRCEIGTHCHPWNTPPFEEKISKVNSMLCNLSYDLLCRKLKLLHKQISSALGYPPVCFRAGRWGFGPNVAKCIDELGYKIDTSISPLCDWSKEHGPDFSEAPTFQYRFNPDNILIHNPEGAILEIPPTIGFFQKNFNRSFRIRKKIINSNLSKFHFIGVFEKLRILNFQWLSPEVSTESQMIRLAKNFIRLGYSHLNMTFHSTSLLPGRTPFVLNEKDLQRFFRKVKNFLIFCKKNGLEFSKVTDLIES